VGSVVVDAESLHGTLVRRPERCSLLDVAFGTGALDTARTLTEFHRMKLMRDGLRIAIASGKLAAARVAWDRLSQGREHRFDRLEVAAGLHRREPLLWLPQRDRLGARSVLRAGIAATPG
jgi:hypothetical protein